MMLRSLSGLLILLAACHSRITYPPGGYAYPEHVADKDTDFYYFPIRNKLARLDSFRDVMAYESYRALDEPNLSLRPMSTDIFRFTYGTALNAKITIISLTPKEIIVKIGVPSDEFETLPDTMLLMPLERRLVRLLDYSYPLDDTSRHHSANRQHYLDSMGHLYPQLYDPAYYLALLAKEYKHAKPIYTYTCRKTPIPIEAFDHLIKGFNDAGYWNIKLGVPCSETPFDGDGFTLEANTASQYNFVSGSSCSDTDSGHFKRACLELIRYAGLKNLIWDSNIQSDTAKKSVIVEDVQLEEVKEEPPKPKKHKKHLAPESAPPLKTPHPN